MLYFSKNEADKQGFTAEQNKQFAGLVQERNNSALDVYALIKRTRNGGDTVQANELTANAVQDIKTLYKGFDQTVLKQFQSASEFTLLNDLTPLSRSVDISESVYEYFRTGGENKAQTSMSGQVGALLNATAYSSDGTMIPVHDDGFKFTWRDPIFNKGSVLQSVADAQENSVRGVRLKFVDYIFDGFKDEAGNYIQVDGLTWKGVRADERVQNVALTFNFATSTDATKIRAEAIKLRDALRITNKQYGEQTWYISSEIMSNFEQYFDSNQIRTVLEELKKLSGIKDIKEDSKLTGNQILIVPLSAGVIAPVVGQAFGTVADPRAFYNSDYVWRTWGAAGLMVKTDIAGNHSVIYASS